MAISQRAVGAWAYAASGSVTPTLPTHATGDMLLVRVAFKSSAVSTCVASTATSGWAKVQTSGSTQFTGATNSGNGTGSVNMAVFWKEAASSSETNPTITFATAVTQVGHVAVSYQKGAGDAWATPFVGAAGVPGAAFTATTSVAINVGGTWAAGTVVAGDLLDFWLAAADDTTITVPTVTHTGVTFATVAEYPATAGTDTSGADGAYDGGYRLATAGSSSSGEFPNVQATLSTSETGTVWATRLRVTSSGTSASAQVATATGAAQGNPGTTAADDFSDNQTDTWASADTGGAWTLNGTAANWDKAGGVGTVVVPAGNVYIARLTSTDAADVIGYVRGRYAGASPTNADLFVVLRAADIDNLYCAGVRFDTDGTADALINEKAGSEAILASTADVGTYTSGEDWSIRFEAIGTTLRVKIWESSGSEPGSWTVSTTDATRTTGQVGLRFVNNSGASLTFTVDDFIVTPAATVANIKANAGVAAGTGVAPNASATVSGPVETADAVTATATGAALDIDAKVAPTAQVAAGTGAAYNASVSTAVSVMAGVATATASAGPAAAGTSPYSTLVQQDQPNGYWRLGEASGNPQDTSGHGNHVTTTGGTPTYGVTGSLAADPNTAITLDGSTEYFSVPQAASLHGNTISIELWFKRAATGGTQFVWDNGFGDSELYFSSDVIYFGRAGVATLRQSAGTYTDTDWHHLVAVKDGASSREIYVDGVAVGTGGSDSTLANANGVSGIGAQQAWNNHWNGSLDEVAVYAYALTAGQVLAHYTAGVPAAATSANAEVATATGAALDADAAPGEYVNPDVAAATGTALGTTTSIAATVGAATGTAAAYDATASTASMVSATAQVATATGAAVAAAPSVAPDLDAATATGTAITATAHETQPANLQAAAGTGEALGTDAKVGATSVVAAATGAGLSPDAALKVNAGVATGTGAALVADGLPGTRALANVATATGAASVADGLPGELAPAEVAATAGAAQNGTTKIAPTLQAATATGAANNATVSVASTGQVTGQTALASGTALGTTAKVVANLNVATGTGTAANPSVSTSLARTPGVAAGTGAAANATAKIVVNAATAAATGTAANATVTTTAAASATAQVATAQGAAHAATVGAASSISANAVAATATGAAYNATIIVAVAAAAASSTGTAAAASIAVAVAAHAQTATATGTAYDAGVALGAVAALAEAAVATGIAYNARAQTAIGSGIDTASGIHGGIVSLPAIRAGVATVPGVRGGVAVEPGVRGGIVTEPRIKGRVA